ncbi:MAG: hypothetical protein IT374_05515 [Polyangiaceae bacterium]|nr:hypothetical protein [Polyangiaceae bacterium]
MSRGLSWLLCAGALLGGCAYGVDDGSDPATAEEGAPLDVASPVASPTADPGASGPEKPQPDPWTRLLDPRENTEAGGVEPGKPQPDPWRAPTVTPTSATQQK